MTPEQVMTLAHHAMMVGLLLAARCCWSRSRSAWS